MKNLLNLSFLFILVFSACKKDEEISFIDELENIYTGSIVDFTCAVPQEVSAPSNATVEIAKVTENEINVAIKGNTGELFNFQGTISSDSTFMIEPFVVGTDTFNGIGKKTDKLEIFLGDGCVLFGSEVVTSQFTEN